MSAPVPNPSLAARLAGMLVRPRVTLAAAVPMRAWAGMWGVVLALGFLPGAAFLTTDIGRQALVDERVRVTEAFGGTVSDAAYAALQAQPPLLAWFTSGGRPLLWPPVTLAVAGVVWWLARTRRPATSYAEALTVATHASVPLAIGQLAALPAHVIRESLTSPFNLAALTPGLDEGTVAARLLGGIEIAGLWWLALLAVGVTVLAGRPARGVFVRLLAAYAGVAAILAAALALAGGS
jgi:Yip1 domain